MSEVSVVYADCSLLRENIACTNDVSSLGCHCDDWWAGADSSCLYREYLGSDCEFGDIRVRERLYACDAGSNACSGSGCFTGNTKVETVDGEKEIKDIKEGDIVKSFDSVTGEVTESTVRNPYTVESDHIYTIKTADGSVINVTGEHPFYVGDESDQLPKPFFTNVSAFLTKLKIYFVSGLRVVGIKTSSLLSQ